MSSAFAALFSPLGLDPTADSGSPFGAPAGWSPAVVKIAARAAALRTAAAQATQQRAWEGVVNRWDPRWRDWQGVADYLESELHIVTQDGQDLVPFRLRRIQRQIIAREIRARRAGKQPLFVILKFRKVGATTLELGLNYWQASRKPNQLCASYAHTPQDTVVMFQHVDRFWNEQAEDRRHKRSPARVTQIEFTDLHSFIYARTAGKGGAGRGGSYARLHVAEASRVEKLGQLHSALYKARGASGSLVYESTAFGRNGVGQGFYEMWDAASKGKSDIIPIFIPWQDDPANKLALVAPDEIDDVLKEDAEAAELMVKHRLSKEQMKWWLRERRGLVIEARASSLIHQEVPSAAEDAFLVDEGSYYDLELLKACDALAAKHETEGHLATDANGRERVIGPGFVVQDNGRLRLWELPDRAKPARYVIGVDPAGGRGKDDTAIVILNARTGEQAAEWIDNRTVPDVVGSDVLPRLARRWAHPTTGEPAFVVVEQNNHGHACLTGLLKIAEFSKESVYHYTDETKVDEYGNSKPTQRAGWEHTSKTHQNLVAAVANIVKDHHPFIKSKRTIQSIRDVKQEGADGAEFTGRDLAVAAGMAAIGLPYAKEQSTTIWVGGKLLSF